MLFFVMSTISPFKLLGMTAMGRKHLNPASALSQIQFTYRTTCKIVCYKADAYKMVLGPEADGHLTC